jgi:hypothetical protein
VQWQRRRWWRRVGGSLLFLESLSLPVCPVPTPRVAAPSCSGRSHSLALSRESLDLKYLEPYSTGLVAPLHPSSSLSSGSEEAISDGHTLASRLSLLKLTVTHTEPTSLPATSRGYGNFVSVILSMMADWPSAQRYVAPESRDRIAATRLLHRSFRNPTPLDMMCSP